MTYSTISRMLKPDSRAPLALWVLDGALERLIRTGTLEVRLPDGETRRYGTGTPAIGVAIHDWPTLRRIAVHPDLALGESWMEGGLTVEKGDLFGLISLCLENYQNARDVNRHSKLTPYRHPILTPLMLSRPGAA